VDRSEISDADWFSVYSKRTLISTDRVKILSSLHVLSLEENRRSLLWPILLNYPVTIKNEHEHVTVSSLLADTETGHLLTDIKYEY
jgi:hypothetical protein